MMRAFLLLAEGGGMREGPTDLPSLLSALFDISNLHTARCNVRDKNAVKDSASIECIDNVSVERLREGVFLMFRRTHVLGRVGGMSEKCVPGTLSV